MVPDDGLEDGPMFARVEVSPEQDPLPSDGFVTIDFGEATIRLPGDVAARRIADIAHALRETR